MWRKTDPQQTFLAKLQLPNSHVLAVNQPALVKPLQLRRLIVLAKPYPDYRFMNKDFCLRPLNFEAFFKAAIKTRIDIEFFVSELRLDISIFFL